MEDTTNNVYPCPGPHDGSLNIHFKQVIIPFGVKDYHTTTPSVNNPADYRYLSLIARNLAWNGYDVIKAHNKGDGSDAVIYLGVWEEERRMIIN